MKKPSIILLLSCFAFLAKAQPYLLFERDTVSKKQHVVYLYDANSSPGIHQDDRLVDSIHLELKTPIRAINLSMSVSNPLTTGTDLSLEISIFEAFNPIDPRDDRFLQSVIWQGQVNDFSRLNLPEPRRINIPQSKVELETPKMRLNLDTLFRK